MIRRNPTMIPMTDSDVQDIRDMAPSQIQEDNRQAALLNKMSKLIQSSLLTKDDKEMQKTLAGKAKKNEEENKTESGARTRLWSNASANNTSRFLMTGQDQSNPMCTTRDPKLKTRFGTTVSCLDMDAPC